MSFAVSRAVVRQSRFAVRRAGLRNASSTSEAAGAAKEKAAEASYKVQSKASEGLTKVKSSAESAASSVGNAASNAAGTVNSAASKVQGRTGRLIGAVQGKSHLPWAPIEGGSAGGSRESGHAGCCGSMARMGSRSERRVACLDGCPSPASCTAIAPK